jgi:hypothetical protein
MLRQDIIAEQILETVKAHPECTLYELMISLPELSWFEICYEVDRLSRSGQLQLSQSSLGLTTTLHAL